MQLKSSKSYQVIFKTLLNSSSGGFFSALCEYVISHNGIVYGAAFDDCFRVKTIEAATMEQCAAFRGSKYVQSDMSGIYVAVKKNLQRGALVCFSGTPCQVAGLRNFLRKEYENLILVDFVCHGISSPMLWDEYRKMMEKKYNSRIVQANFRSKKYGYQSSSMQLLFESGRIYQGSPRVDMMLKSFFGDVSSRYSCYSCPAKGKERCSDFTIWDCWHADKLLNHAVDDLGYTNVVARSEAAIHIIKKISSNLLTINDVDLERIYPTNGGGMMVRSVKKDIRRDEYLLCVKEKGIEKAFCQYLPNSTLDYMVEMCKTMLHQLGILGKLSRWKKQLRKKLKK